MLTFYIYCDETENNRPHEAPRGICMGQWLNKSNKIKNPRDYLKIFLSIHKL